MPVLVLRWPSWKLPLCNTILTYYLVLMDSLTLKPRYRDRNHLPMMNMWGFWLVHCIGLSLFFFSLHGERDVAQR